MEAVKKIPINNNPKKRRIVVKELAKKACYHCKRGHRKCDDERPCNNCKKSKKECFDVVGENKRNKLDAKEDLSNFQVSGDIFFDAMLEDKINQENEKLKKENENLRREIEKLKNSHFLYNQSQNFYDNLSHSTPSEDCCSDNLCHDHGDLNNKQRINENGFIFEEYPLKNNLINSKNRNLFDNFFNNNNIDLTNNNIKEESSTSIYTKVEYNSNINYNKTLNNKNKNKLGGKDGIPLDNNHQFDQTSSMKFEQVYNDNISDNTIFNNFNHLNTSNVSNFNHLFNENNEGGFNLNHSENKDNLSKSNKNNKNNTYQKVIDTNIQSNVVYNNHINIIPSNDKNLRSYLNKYSHVGNDAPDYLFQTCNTTMSHNFIKKEFLDDPPCDSNNLDDGEKSLFGIDEGHFNIFGENQSNHDFKVDLHNVNEEDNIINYYNNRNSGIINETSNKNFANNNFYDPNLVVNAPTSNNICTNTNNTTFNSLLNSFNNNNNNICKVTNEVYRTNEDPKAPKIDPIEYFNDHKYFPTSFLPSQSRKSSYIISNFIQTSSSKNYHPKYMIIMMSSEIMSMLLGYRPDDLYKIPLGSIHANIRLEKSEFISELMIKKMSTTPMINVRIRDYFKEKSGKIIEFYFNITVFNGHNDFPAFSFAFATNYKILENPTYDKQGFLDVDPTIEFLEDPFL